MVGRSICFAFLPEFVLILTLVMKTSARVAILAVVVVACLCLTEGLPEPRLTRSKQQRPTRGFKNVEMMTARGFGKRDKPPSRAELYNMENFWEALESSPEKDGQEGNDIKSESIPVDWFVNEMLNNPEFARAAVRKFIDLNQDDLLTSDELLRNVISK